MCLPVIEHPFVGLLSSAHTRQFFALSGIVLYVPQNMGCSRLGVTFYCRLLSSAGLSVFLCEPLDDWRRIFGQIYLKTEQRLNPKLRYDFRVEGDLP